MDFKKSSIIEKILLFLVCAAMVFMLYLQSDVGQTNLLNHITEISNGWYYMENGQKIPVTLPSTIQVNNDDDLILYCDSLTKKDANRFLTTRGAVYRLSVSVGKHALYQYDDSEFPRNVQMASKVNCSVALPDSYSGETIALTFKNTQNGVFHVGKVCIGDSLEVFWYHCSRDAVNLFIVFVMAILAVLSIGICLYIRHMHVEEKRFCDISLFLIVCVVWFLTDSSVGQMFGGSATWIRYISFYAFMLLAIPMLHFIKNTDRIKKYKVIDVIIYLFYGNVLIQSILNYLGMLDFVDMLFVTHILLFSGIAVLIRLLVKAYKESGDRELYSILVSFAVVAGGGVISLILYWLLKISYYEVFFEVGIVIFIILLIRMLVIAMVENLRFRTEAVVYQRLAKEDALTGMKNRRAFDEMIAKAQKNSDSYHSLFLVFMDLNQLKLINDTHGHHVGDEMIIATARCIEKAFGSMGTCYRIGGDEFCALLPNITLSEKELSDCLDEKIQQYNSICGKYQISLARGISNLRDEQGNLKTISDWKQEADIKMYQNKGWVKRLD